MEGTSSTANRRSLALSTPTIIPRDQHPISRKSISPNALKVLYRLHKQGFQAFLVGGGVRDLLLGLQPKDFDVATNAHPEQIKDLFYNCRLIGRRFRLAHVHFGQEIIEVATFRGGDLGLSSPDLEQTTEGMLLRDNIYGSLEEDVWRRDFTVNALYYNIDDFTVVDYVGGMADIENKQLRLIGDPETRYREDPVRMLRAVRFSTKLNFTLHPSTEAPLSRLADLLQQVAPGRMFEEYIKMFLFGCAESNYQALRHYGLFPYIFSQTEMALKEPLQGAVNAALFDQAVRNTDQRFAEGKSIAPAFLLAVFLWPTIRKSLFDEGSQKFSMDVEELHRVVEEVLAEQRLTFSIPKWMVLMMRDMWHLQPRLIRCKGSRAHKLIHLPRFRAAYDLLELRAAAGEEGTETLAAWWREYTEADDSTRKQMEKMGEGRKNKRRKRTRKKPKTATPSRDIEG